MADQFNGMGFRCREQNTGDVDLSCAARPHDDFVTWHVALLHDIGPLDAVIFRYCFLRMKEEAEHI